MTMMIGLQFHSITMKAVTITNTHTQAQDIWDIEKESIKDGVTTITRDTVVLSGGANGVDTLELFY